jgi:hypothetical protein
MIFGPAARAVRAATFAAVCVTTTALGHALMSKTVPWWALGAAFFGTGAAAYCLTGRERGVMVVTASTVAAQLALHRLFDLAQASMSVSAGVRPAQLLLRQDGWGSAVTHMSAPTPMDGMAGMAGMDMSRMSSSSGVMSSGMEHLRMAHTGHGTLGMFLTHLAAALVCGWWLWRGEAACFQLARSVAGLLFTPLLLALTAHGWAGLRLPARPPAAAPVLRLSAALLRDIASRRGPPRPVFCC